MKSNILKIGNICKDWDGSIYLIENINENNVIDLIIIKRGTAYISKSHMDWYIKKHCKLIGTGSSKIAKALYG